MSGRSAYVRKKINEAKAAEIAPAGSSKGRANSSESGRSSSRRDYGVQEQPASPDTGYSTTDLRLLKFSESFQENEFSKSRPENTALGNQNSSNQNGGDAGTGGAHTPRYRGPMPDFACARVRRPVLKAEDVSGIERSGFRSDVDKKSEGVRKGITKAFTFGGKKKRKDPDAKLRSPLSIESRPFDDYDTSLTTCKRGHRSLANFRTRYPQLRRWSTTTWCRLPRLRSYPQYRNGALHLLSGGSAWVSQCSDGISSRKTLSSGIRTVMCWCISDTKSKPLV